MMAIVQAIAHTRLNLSIEMLVRLHRWTNAKPVC